MDTGRVRSFRIGMFSDVLMILSVISTMLLKVVATACWARANLSVFWRLCVGSADASAAGMLLLRPLSVVSELCERVNESFLVLAACTSSAATRVNESFLVLAAGAKSPNVLAPSKSAATPAGPATANDIEGRNAEEGWAIAAAGTGPDKVEALEGPATAAVEADDPSGARRSSKPRSIVGSLSGRAPSSTSSICSPEFASVGLGARGRDVLGMAGAKGGIAEGTGAGATAS